MTARTYPDQTGSAILGALMGMTVISVVCLGTIASLVTSRSLEAANEEKARGTAVARATMEDIMAAPFADVFALFNEDPNDDPEGPGTAPGPVVALAGEADSAVFAEIRFPTLANGSLSESAPVLFDGAPTDLDADGQQGSGPLTGEYKALPVLVEVSWEGVHGASSVTIPRVLTSQSWQKQSRRVEVPVQ